MGCRDTLTHLSTRLGVIPLCRQKGHCWKLLKAKVWTWEMLERCRVRLIHHQHWSQTTCRTIGILAERAQTPRICQKIPEICLQCFPVFFSVFFFLHIFAILYHKVWCFHCKADCEHPGDGVNGNDHLTADGAGTIFIRYAMCRWTQLSPRA